MPPLSAAPAAEAAPTVLMEGVLYKFGGSSMKYLPSAATRRLLSWKPKTCRVLSDGSFSYASSSDGGACSTTAGRDSGGADNSDSSDDDTRMFCASLLPYGSAALGRAAQLEILGDLPAGTCAGGAFTLRTRGPAGPKKIRLLAKNREDAEAWRRVADTAALAGSRSSRFSPLLAVWDEAMGADGKVDVDDIAALLKHVNVKVKEEDVRAALKAPNGGVDRVAYDGLLAVLENEAIATSAREMWVKAGGEAVGFEEAAEVLGVDTREVRRRLEGRGFDVAELEEARTDKSGGSGVVGAFLLQQLLCGEENSACDPRALELGDMSRSMSEYFMNSSHNTYLTGDQLTSDSSPVMYRLVLEAGGRCVEIDMWDGDEGPVVTHGHTATSKISLRSVLAAIKEYSFVASEFPVVLSLENHLCEEQQVLAATIIREELGDALAVIALTDGEQLPSLESLKRKVLVKAKKGKWGQGAASVSVDGVAADGGEDGLDEEDDDDGSEDERKGAEISPKTERSLRSMFGSLSLLKKKTGSSSPKGEEKKKKTIVIAKELAEITSFGGANRKKLCALWETGTVHPARQLASDIVSINETKVAELFEGGQGSVLREYNQRNMTRVYPKGTRVDSSNYNPMLGWAAGCQITAINFQSPDRGLWLNHGRFMINGRSGYVLKDAPESVGDSSIVGAGMLSLKVMFGSLLPRGSASVTGYDVADPYVEATLVRCTKAGEVDEEKRRTKSISGNGLSPCWGERLQPLPVSDADMDMLLIAVWDEDLASKDDLIGFFCAPVHALRTGLRSMPLCTSEGTPLRLPGTNLAPAIVCDIEWKKSTTGAYSSLT